MQRWAALGGGDDLRRGPTSTPRNKLSAAEEQCVLDVPLKAKLKALGISPSFSRPRVSNDNPYSEALFRTLKYRPTSPSRPFADIHAALTW